MLKHSLAPAVLFSAVAANAAEPVVVPHYTLNTSTESANGTIVVTPRGYVVASMPGSIPEVSTCAKNTDEILGSVGSIIAIVDMVRVIGAANTSEGQTVVSDLADFAGGMRFSFEQCQKSAQPETKDKAQQAVAVLDALQSKLNSLRKPAL